MTNPELYHVIQRNINNGHYSEAVDNINIVCSSDGIIILYFNAISWHFIIWRINIIYIIRILSPRKWLNITAHYCKSVWVGIGGAKYTRSKRCSSYIYNTWIQHITANITANIRSLEQKVLKFKRITVVRFYFPTKFQVEVYLTP